MGEDKSNCLEASSDELIWDERFSVKALVMDRQHRSLFDLINEVRKACIEGADQKTMLDTIHRLYEYASTHFRDEENIMSSRDPALLEEQQKQHAIFLDYVFHLEEKVKANSNAVDSEILTFLKVWWEEHILKLDKQYSKYF